MLPSKLSIGIRMGTVVEGGWVERDWVKEDSVEEEWVEMDWVERDTEATNAAKKRVMIVVDIIAVATGISLAILKILASHAISRTPDCW